MPLGANPNPGKKKLLEGIQSYTSGRTFHYTMTNFWVEMVNLGILSASSISSIAQNDADSFGLFLALSPSLCDAKLWSQYYDAFTMMSHLARELLVEADKQSLPVRLLLT